MDSDRLTGTKTNRREFLQTVAAGAGAGAPVLLPGLPGDQVNSSSGYPDLAQLRAAHERKGIIPPNRTYRSIEWEFHTPPEASFDIDVEAAMNATRDAGAETVMVYAQSCWGHAFYPSDVAVRHPRLTYDLFGKEVETAHKLGMSVIAYYSLEWNNQIVLGHPDWGWVNEKGEAQRFRWFVTCLDSPYRQYVLNMIDEIASRYEIDQLFLDVFGTQVYTYHTRGMDPFCYCKYTEAAWEKDHPRDPYREGLKTQEGWRQRYRWMENRTTREILDSIIAVLRRHRPNALISLNGGPQAFPYDVMQRTNFTISEPLNSPTGIGLGSILLRGWGQPDYQVGVYGRQGYLDTYPSEISRVQVDSLILQNARTFLVGNAPIISGLDGRGFSQRWFKVAKQTWEDVRNVDCLLEGIRPVTNAAMLYSESTRSESDLQRRPVDFLDSVLGALETLTYAGRPVESLPEFRLTAELLQQFELLVLPEVEVLSEAQGETIRHWVEQGGTLLASQRCGLLDEKHQPRSNFPLADVLGVDYAAEERKYAYDAEGKLKENFTAIYLESSGHALANQLSLGTVGLPGSFLRVKRTTAEEVMRYRLPFMVEDLPHNKWFNWGPPPPGPETGGPAVTYNRFGKGQAVYLGVPVFRAMKERPFWIRQWIPELVRQLVTDPIAEIRSEPFSEYVHGTFFYDRSRKAVLVQVLNAIELATQGECRPVPKVHLTVNPAKLKVVGARMIWPEARDLSVGTHGGRIHLVLNAPPRYVALHLKLA
jgi:hypothetical protein